MPLPAIVGAAISGVTAIGNIIDKFVQTPEEKEVAEQIKMRLAMEPDAAQVELNKIEAAHDSIFVAGARPFILWVCGFAFAYTFVAQPFLIFIAQAAALYFGLPILDLTLLPELDWSVLMPVLMGILGLGGLRTFEKMHGVARSKI